MATAVNQIRLYSGSAPDIDSGGFPCIHLPPDIGVPERERQSYVEISDGHLASRARVWMTKTQFEALPETFRQGSTTLGISMSGITHSKSSPTEAPKERQIDFGPHFYLVDASIARTAPAKGASNAIEAIYEVRLATIQHWWMYKCVNLAFNMLSDDALEYAARAKGAGSPYTYQEIVDELGSEIGVSFGSVPRDASDSIGSPQNQVFRYIPGGHAVHRLLQPLGMHIVCNPYGASLAFEVKKLENDSTEFDTLNALAAAAIFEGTQENAAGITPTNVMPEKVKVLYPKEPTPPMDEERYCAYEKNAPSSTGVISGTIDCIFVGDHNCVCDENLKKYPEDLDALADERAEAYYRRAAIPYEDYVFVGGYDFVPGASIRRVRMTMDVSGWFTHVSTHGMYQEPRQDLEKLFNRIKSPHWPEHGEPFNIEVDPRDDGTIDIRVPNLGSCSSSSVSGSSESSESSGSSASVGSPSSESAASEPSLPSLPSESSAPSAGSGGASSAGSAGSAGACPDGCVEVLKDVAITFNAQTCELTITKTKICVAECPEEEGE